MLNSAMPSRILVACSSPPDSGSGILAYAKDLVQELVARGIETYFASPSPRSREWLDRYGVIHIPTERNGDPIAQARSLLDEVRSRNIEGVINNDNPLVQSIAPFLNCPLLSVGHMSKSSIASLAAFNHVYTDYVVAISYDMQRVFVQRFGVPVHKCPVIHSGIQEAGLPSPIETGRDGRLRAVFAGGDNREYKGADLVARMLTSRPAVAEICDIRWYGNVSDRLRTELAGLPNVVFRGRLPREEFRQELAQADVFLLPSRYEGCPVALIEAMSMGLVPVASDGVGAMRWLIESCKDGFVVPLRNWPAMAADVLIALSANREMLVNMRRQAYATFQRDLRMARVCDALLEKLRLPTVDRGAPPQAAMSLRWHRPLRSDGLKAPIIDRVAIRLGVLRKAGLLTRP